MSQSRTTAASPLATVGCFTVVALLAVWLTEVQMRRSQMLTEDRVCMDRLLAGIADKPFCYRALVPALVRVLAPVLPQSLCADVAPALLPAGLPLSHPAAYVALALILLSSLLAYAAISGAIYRRYFSVSPYAACMGAIGVLAFLALFVARELGHVYDFTVLMFSAAMLLTLAQGRLRSYLILFALSCLNKETTIMMTFAYGACLYDRIPRRRFVVYLLLQAFIFLLVFGGVKYCFRDNAGMGMEIWLYKIPSLICNWAGNLGLLLVLGIVVAYRWSEKPLVMRRAMVLLIPNVALYALVVFPGEIRALYESVPLLALFSMRTLELFASRRVSFCRPELPPAEEGESAEDAAKGD